MPVRLQQHLRRSVNSNRSTAVKQPQPQIAGDKITFIIPTIGRISLIQSINSIRRQTIHDHHTVVIFDGVRSTLSGLRDDRFNVIEIPKKGWQNCAAHVRHEGIQWARTKWLAFLDDDDTISETYVEKFLQELTLHPDVDVIIFRMIGHERDNFNIIPRLETISLEHANVGISFAMKKSVYELYQFEASSMEDFLMLKKLQENGHKMVISPHVTYFVKGNQFGRHNLGNRLLINF